MARSNKTKEEIFRDGFSLFVNKIVPKPLLDGYLKDLETFDGEATSNLQVWIVNNLKPELNDWITGIGIIEAVELLYNSALENGNLGGDI